MRWNFIDISVVNSSQIGQIDLIFFDIHHWISSYNCQKNYLRFGLSAGDSSDSRNINWTVYERGLSRLMPGMTVITDQRYFWELWGSMIYGNVVISQQCFCIFFSTWSNALAYPSYSAHKFLKLATTRDYVTGCSVIDKLSYRIGLLSITNWVDNVNWPPLWV